ncbi:O-methyltransferase [Candidatus Methanoperedens nitroreducens]|uniref:O-methyltransferase n=1 Tax=Candidatus Methanoperedens nitratireducens TaxID=1392998 RepID=A0A062V848_9EURY|nr:methyltransferase [Candidatus Methanoperedens nitroreducens]KCZ73447.1 O-methyltransferase [Candidatus Methanoperedens nitroreducens]MDJ1422597.1 methyltransferase [Candidatus Methanoperedens sp.]
MLIQEICSGYWKSSVLFTANKLHLFTKLGNKQLSKEEIAREYKADTGGMEKLLNACVSMGLLEKKSGLYKNSEFSSKFLAEGKDWYQGYIIAHWADMFVAGHWQRLEKAVLTGSPVRGIEDRLYDEKNEWGFGNGLYNWVIGMHNWAMAEHAELLASAVDLEGRKNLIDIGGGSGTYSIVLCQKYKNLNAIVFDLPEVIEIAKKIIEKYNLSDRITTISGDLRYDSWDQGDVILLSNVLHMGKSDFCKKALKKCYESLPAGGLVIIQEWFLNPDKTAPTLSALFSLHILARPGGDVYSASEMMGWMHDIGFANIKEITLPGLWSLVTAEKL